MIFTRGFFGLVFFCFCLVLMKEAPAQLSRWDYGGYFKNLITYADGDIESLPFLEAIRQSKRERT